MSGVEGFMLLDLATGNTSRLDMQLFATAKALKLQVLIGHSSCNTVSLV
jgi:hypothetical protein